ncbi:DUF362 domain-containing protein [Geomesophilobacter sediminis]|uniref:DUF362 domain-containing protein n=1 Tax=Geomesophilobacter sediminis TaxID=2798584 RepID=A0A8J7J434_9BACT|nr:DUF362 domain-containing protein [Geomesophilobacter sediminis]MBJ6725488.1 DUF362 domain-containing protein [Geomesophilobacter sediminis]
MQRRSFLKLVGLSAFFHQWLLRDLSAAQGPVVAVAEAKDHARATRAAIAALGGMHRFVKKGDVVVVKPNIGWDRNPDQAANTNPVVVRAIVEEALAAGAKKVKVFDRSCNDERRCYVNSGMTAALKGMKNVELKFVENERFKKVALRGKALSEWELYDEALHADVFINVPVAKHHQLTKLTLGLKNVMGMMGGNRGAIHKNIDEALADVNQALKSHLVVIDATRVLTAHGPQGGNLADVKHLHKVIASTDIVAADAYATTLFGHKPEDISVTVAAHRRGLGEMNLKKVRIVKA